jgi:ribosomal protein S12 methylthiotransferase accessory factor
MNTQQYNRKLLKKLSDIKILDTIYNLTHVFYDEPKAYHYGAKINIPKGFTDGYKQTSDVTAGGVSFFSKNSALLKCLVETIERFSFYTYKNHQLEFASFSQLQKKNRNPIDLKPYGIEASFHDLKIGWVMGRNLIENKDCFIPAQLVYVNYKNTKNEKHLSPIITTGGAAANTLTESLISGIYELIERDAYMTMYLTSSMPQLINTKTIKNQKIKDIISSYERYCLLPYVFEITNDLEVPVIMTIVIDSTGLGPRITVGLKSNFDKDIAIIGSLNEAYATRTWLREEIMEGNLDKNKVAPSDIRTFIQRAAFWFDKNNINKINNLICQKKIAYKTSKKVDKKNEYLKLLSIFKKNKYDLIYADVTRGIFEDLDISVVKVISPQLQPLYIDEKYRFYKLQRLKMAAEYFGNKNYTLNNIPHPFL